MFNYTHKHIQIDLYGTNNTVMRMILLPFALLFANSADAQITLRTYQNDLTINSLVGIEVIGYPKPQKPAAYEFNNIIFHTSFDSTFSTEKVIYQSAFFLRDTTLFPGPDSFRLFSSIVIPYILMENLIRPQLDTAYVLEKLADINRKFVQDGGILYLRATLPHIGMESDVLSLAIPKATQGDVEILDNWMMGKYYLKYSCTPPPCRITDDVSQIITDEDAHLQIYKLIEFKKITVDAEDPMHDYFNDPSPLSEKIVELENFKNNCADFYIQIITSQFINYLRVNESHYLDYRNFFKKGK